MIKQYNGFKAERTSGREPLPAGGYVARILNAEVKTTQSGKDMLVLSFDITEGEHAGFFKTDYNANTNEDKKWRGVYRLFLPTDDGSERDGWSKRSFNEFIAVIEESNPGYHFDWNEVTLKGKQVGVLFREKEWEKDDRHGWTTECCSMITPEEIREGKFRMPKPKALKKDTKTTTATATSATFDYTTDDGELPF